MLDTLSYTVKVRNFMACIWRIGFFFDLVGMFNQLHEYLDSTIGIQDAMIEENLPSNDYILL